MLLELNNARGVARSNLGKRDFIALKAEIDKRDMFQLVWIIQKQKVDDLDVVKLKTIPVDFTEISDAVSKEVVRNTKINKLNS